MDCLSNDKISGHDTIKIMQNKLQFFWEEGQKILPGNKTQLRLGLLALVLKRNVLIEDVPGMGKTTLVKFFAKSSGLEFRRIQFTSDLMPSDILGVSIFQKETESFLFRPGPIFGELILADELNRGTPKTQSALLQAMEEKHVTVDGEGHPLPDRFCLFATQNPRGQYGTHPLPESQLDRFFFKFSMGHLSKEEELAYLKTGPRAELINAMKPLFRAEDLRAWEEQVSSLKVSQMMYQYLADVLEASRLREDQWGLSPRAGMDLLEASKGHAFLEGRDHVLPDDLQAIFPYVAAHRLYSYQNLSVAQEQQKAQDFIRKVSLLSER